MFRRHPPPVHTSPMTITLDPATEQRIQRELDRGPSNLPG